MKVIASLAGYLQDRPKIFCIGFNKTGTTSLHEHFRAAGLKSLHDHMWTIPSHMPSGKIYFHKSQCFSDGEKANFVNLHRWFPTAQFVLNTRDERKWLMSRVKHVMRFNEIPNRQELLQRRQFGTMAKEFFFNPEAAIQKWALERRIYEDQACTFFADKSCFLKLDLTTQTNWQRRMNTHLSAQGVPHKNVEAQIHSNKRDRTELVDQARLDKYVEIVDRCIS